MLGSVNYTPVGASSPEGTALVAIPANLADQSKKYPILFNQTEINSEYNKTGMMVLQQLLKSPAEKAGLDLSRVSSSSVIHRIDAEYRTAMTKYNQDFELALHADMRRIDQLLQEKKFVPVKVGSVVAFAFGTVAFIAFGGVAIPLIIGVISGIAGGTGQHFRDQEGTLVEGSTNRRNWFVSVKTQEDKRNEIAMTTLNLAATKLVDELVLQRQHNEIDQNKLKELEHLEKVYSAISEDTFYVQSISVPRTDVKQFVLELKTLLIRN